MGIGTTQLAKHLGLTVIGTAGSKEGLELVKSAGRADLAFNHNDPTYVDQIKVWYTSSSTYYIGIYLVRLAII